MIIHSKLDVVVLINKFWPPVVAMDEYGQSVLGQLIRHITDVANDIPSLQTFYTTIHDAEKRQIMESYLNGRKQEYDRLVELGKQLAANLSLAAAVEDENDRLRAADRVNRAEMMKALDNAIVELHL
jgi:hypothetical protein